jgi:hypothetical protein
MQFEHTGGAENTIFIPRVDPINAHNPGGVSNPAFLVSLRLPNTLK